jgi:hypothetical protein
MESMSLTSHGKREWPPERVWREVDEAAHVWEDLQAQGCELHFEVDEQSGRLIIEMRELDGDVLGTLSASEVAALASGSPVR